MHEEFKQLAAAFGKYADRADDLTDDAWRQMCSRTQVVMMAGGESKRLRGITGAQGNKVVTPLPNGDTMLEYNIRFYRDAGLVDFILMVAHQAEAIQELIGDGSKYGVHIRYHVEPEKPLAKGGAIRLALANKAIDRSKYMIVHNAGDIFIGYAGNIPRELAAHHIQFEKKGSVATIVSAPMSLVQGSFLKINDGYVESISFEPYVPVPYHTNATMFSPAIYDIFETLFALGEKAEFESVLFPYLAERHALTAMRIDNQFSLQVKNEKQWAQLMALFDQK